MFVSIGTQMLRFRDITSRCKPGTALPGLADAVPNSERESVARRLYYAYLRAVPVLP